MPKITTTENGYILETNFRFASNVFLLFDKNGDFVEKSADYNFLHKKLIAMEKPQEPEAPKTPLYYYRGAMFILN